MSVVWKASLRGNSPILYNLERMNSMHFSIGDISDDHEAEYFLLHSSHMNGLKDANEVFSAYQGLVELLNGSLALEWGFDGISRRGFLSIDEIFISSEDYSKFENIQVDKNIPASNPFIGKPDINSIQAPFTYKTTAYLELALEHEDIFQLLRLLAAGFDWRNLYCIWDTVSFYSGGSKATPKALGLDEDRIKAFTGTVNNFGVLGVAARHGVMGWKVPQNIVTHEEAITIINDVVEKYLKKKHCLGCASQRWRSSYMSIRKGKSDNLFDVRAPLI
jgi:hypothetical protein